MKKKMLIFHPALAPYRIDQFNNLNDLFDLHIVFLYDNLWTFKFDQELLLSQCTFKVSFLLIGPRHKGKVFRFGMYKKIKSINPDLILGYEYSFTTQYLILLKHLGLIKQKIGSMIDDSIDMCFNIQSGVRYQARKYSIDYLDYIVLMSHEVSLYYQDHLNFKKEKIIVSPIIQNPERLRKNSKQIESFAERYVSKYDLMGKKVLLFVGRLIPEKALPLFLNNIHSLLLENLDLVFVIVGEGRENELLQPIIKEKKLDDRVLLVGRYDNEELYSWYLSASGFVLPSLFEPFGAVVNEALIFGLPVFCSKYAGASCLITTDNGLIFDPSNNENTLQRLKLFLTMIDPLHSLELRNKPSLMDDDILNFNEEWGKLFYS